MSAPEPKPRLSRRLLPRWRGRRAAVELGESAALDTVLNAEIPQVGQPNQAFERDLVRFQTTPSVPFAADLVGRALIAGAPSAAQDAMDYLRRNTDLVETASLREVALGQGSQTEAFDASQPLIEAASRESLAIAQLKVQLRVSPWNALLWLDLAREYAALGQRDHADRAVRMALGIHPNHRLVLRAASRFFINRHEPDRALELLRRSPATPTDPWLVAAEIATAQVNNRPPRFVRQARAFVRNRDLAPFHLSEVSASLATLELGQAKPRQIRALFEQSLIRPTENALAQAQAVRVRAPDAVPALEAATFDRTREPHEALVWLAEHIGEHEMALRYARAWIQDEPFSTDPLFAAAFQSHLVSESNDEAVALMHRARRLRPDSVLAINNLAYYQVLGGQADDAQRTLTALRSKTVEPRMAAVVQATRGLVDFATGNALLGRQGYEQALVLAAQPEVRRDLEWSAWANLARAEYLFGNLELGRVALERARELIAARSEATPKKVVDDVAALFSRPRSNR